MNQMKCTLSGDREATLIAYVYDELDSPARDAFTAHVTMCVVCRQELDGLSDVRTSLEEWAPPEPGRGFGMPPLLSTPKPVSRWTTVPVWMQTAAAMLAFGVALGAANLHISYDDRGLSVKTGWMSPSVDTREASDNERGRGAILRTAQVTMPTGPDAPASRAELQAIAEQLRRELNSSDNQGTASPTGFVRQVRSLITDSEKKQENDFLLQLGKLIQDMQIQRRTDLEKTDQRFDVLVRDVNREIYRTQQRLAEVNAEVVRVSNTGAR